MVLCFLSPKLKVQAIMSLFSSPTMIPWPVSNVRKIPAKSAKLAKAKPSQAKEYTPILQLGQEVLTQSMCANIDGLAAGWPN